MSGLEIGLLGLAIMLLLMFLRVPIAVSMMIVGTVGYSFLTGLQPALDHLKTGTFWRFSTYDLAIIPMFLLMGEFAAGAGLSTSLFRAANTFFGHRRGGMAMSVVGACAGFGAICGSSLATASTMTRVALPELRAAGYGSTLSTGALAAGGTLGILIPPSVGLVIYAIIVEANIVALFAAAMVPAAIAVLGFMLAVELYVRLNPEVSPAGVRTSWTERWRAFLDTWSTLLIFFLVIGGIYFGWFTPSEAAAVGALGTGLLAYGKGRMRWKGLADAILRTAKATALIFLIILGAEFLNSFLALTRVSYIMAEAFQASGFSPFVILLAILVFYLFLGCIMDSFSMLLLTLPIFWPMLSILDFGMDPEHMKLWFGVLVLVVVELGLITPPLGLNIFVIKSMAPDVPTSDIYRGVFPFIGSELVRLLILLFLPMVSLWLPIALGY